MSLVKLDKVKTQSNYSNKYEGLLDDLKKLTQDTAVLYPIPRGVKYQKFYDRLASILEYRGVKAPDGFMFSRARSEDGKNVVITLRPRRKEASPAPKRSKATKRRRAISKATGLKPSAIKAAEKMAATTRAKGTRKVNKLQADEKKAQAKKLKAARDARYRAKKKAAATAPVNHDTEPSKF